MTELNINFDLVSNIVTWLLLLVSVYLFKEIRALKKPKQPMQPQQQGGYPPQRPNNYQDDPNYPRY